MRRRKAKLPALKPGQPGRPKDDRYREQYGVIVLCAGEAEQKRVYADLFGRGYKCKVVVT